MHVLQQLCPGQDELGVRLDPLGFLRKIDELDLVISANVLSQIAALAEHLAGGVEGVLISRYGGEEFLVCQQLPRSASRARLEALREGIARAGIETPDGDTLRCTVSIGVAELEAGQDLRDLLRVADERLYKAKQQGRNRLVSS